MCYGVGVVVLGGVVWLWGVCVCVVDCVWFVSVGFLGICGGRCGWYLLLGW